MGGPAAAKLVQAVACEPRQNLQGVGGGEKVDHPYHRLAIEAFETLGIAGFKNAPRIGVPGVLDHPDNVYCLPLNVKR